MPGLGELPELSKRPAHPGSTHHGREANQTEVLAGKPPIQGCNILLGELYRPKGIADGMVGLVQREVHHDP